MGALEGNEPPGPNWYPDPGDARFLRYWDGVTWTEHVAPSGMSPGASSGRAKTTWQIIGGLAAGIGIFVAAFVVLSGVGEAGRLASDGFSNAAATETHEVVSAESSEAAAKDDARTLGHDLRDYYLDHEGALPAIDVVAGQYSMSADGGWYRVESQSPGAGFGGVKGTDGSDWCVWMRAPEGETKTWQFSAQGDLAPGSC